MGQKLVSEPLPLSSGLGTSPAADRDLRPETRIPMSLPRTKLTVPKIPGYHCRWIRNNEARIAQALAAHYEFVAKGETVVADHSVAGNRLGEGTDLGSRVTVLSGGINEDGQGARLVLMKLRQEYRDSDDADRAERSGQVVRALRRGRTPQDKAGDDEQRYIKTGQDIFRRRRPLG